MRSTRTRRLVVALVAVTGILATAAAPSEAAAPATRVVVDGAVGVPASYSAADLAALPGVTLAWSPARHRSGSVTGVSLKSLVDAAAPRLPDAKNAALRVTVTVEGAGRAGVAFAYGELDPGFGDHDALLLPGRNTLVVPGDRNDLRTVVAVDAVRVSVSAAEPGAVPAGSLVVRTGTRSVTLTAAQLATLPAVTRTVSFQAGTTPQQHVETGPPLALVLLRAGIVPGLRTSVAAVGADGYVAAVTPAETFPGGRPLVVSTIEDGVPLERPRLVADGDVKGGRYVSALTDLVVTRNR